MKIVKIKIASGAEIYINTDNIAYLRRDLQNDKLTQIHTTRDMFIVNTSLEDTLKYLKEIS